MHKIKKLMFVSSLLFSVSMPVSAAPETMSKDDWLAQLRMIIPKLMCTSFTKSEMINKQLEKFHISQENCVALIPANMEKCFKQYYSSIPPTINNEIADKWGSTLGECIGTDFATQNFENKTPPK